MVLEERKSLCSGKIADLREAGQTNQWNNKMKKMNNDTHTHTHHIRSDSILYHACSLIDYSCSVGNIVGGPKNHHLTGVDLRGREEGEERGREGGLLVRVRSGENFTLNGNVRW